MGLSFTLQKTFRMGKGLAQVLLLTIPFFAVVLFATSAVAQSKGKQRERFALTSYYSNYAQLGFGADASKNMSPSIDLEIALRFNTIFSLTLIYSKFQDPNVEDTAFLPNKIQAAGAGMKIDLPGFFFISSNKQDSSREAKRYPLNTFIFGEVLKFDSLDLTTNIRIAGTAPKYGIGFDLFLFNPYVFLSGRYTFFNYIGESYQSYAGGIGVSF